MEKAEIVSEAEPLRVVTAKSVPDAPIKGALIKSSYSGICHTDLHLIGNKVYLGDGQFIKRSDAFDRQGFNYQGTVPGHELSGTIEAFGCEADAERYGLAVGDRVLVYPWYGCGDCTTCQDGEYQYCPNNDAGTLDMGLGCNPGGYSSHVPVPKLDYLAKVPKNVPMDMASLVPCSGITAYEGVLKTKQSIENAFRRRGSARLLVIGSGGLGLWAVGLAKLEYKLPTNKICVDAYDINEHNLELARKAGADRLIKSDRDKSELEIIEAVTQSGTIKYDAVIDFVGHESTANMALQCLNKNATFVCIGLAGGKLSFPIPKLVPNGLVICGSRTSSLPVFFKLVDLLADGKFKYPGIEHYRINEVNTALDKLRKGDVKGRASLRFI